MKAYVVAFGFGLSFWLTAPFCDAQDSLERALRRQAPRLIEYYQKQDYKNVGVLKFLVYREGETKPSDNVGTFNGLAAQRLESALLLANSPNTPIGIIGNASDVAQKIPEGSHLTKAGREKLFKGIYFLPWGDKLKREKVTADAFVTAICYISKDLRKLHVTLISYDRVTNRHHEHEPTFDVDNTTDRLAEMGESFALRGAFDDGESEIIQAKTQEKVFQQAVKVRDQQAKHPALRNDSPVTLEVFYGDKLGNNFEKVPFEYRAGKVYIAEPGEGQTIQFGLSRDRGKERYGLVLKINGENTLDKQRLPDLSCRKWILKPNAGPWAIGGYQDGNDKRKQFRVASIAESRRREVDYGRDVGTITLNVFREDIDKKAEKKIPSEEQRYEKIIKNLPELSGVPKNFHALKAQLLEAGDRSPGMRGLIMEGKEESSKVEVEPFVADPNPIMLLTIVYRPR